MKDETRGLTITADVDERGFSHFAGLNQGSDLSCLSSFPHSFLTE